MTDRTLISSNRLRIIDWYDRAQLASVAVIGGEIAPENEGDRKRYAWRYVAEDPRTFAGRHFAPTDLRLAHPIEAFGVRLFIETIDGALHLGADIIGESKVEYPFGAYRNYLALKHPDRLRRQWQSPANDRVKINPNLAEALKRMAVTEERKVA